MIKAIFDKHGEDHLETVLACITAARNGGLWSETVGAVSDVLVFRSSWPIPAIKRAFADIDLQKHRHFAVRLRPWPVRGSLRVLIDLDLEKLVKSSEAEQGSAHV
ncbi:hypothetical protein [Sinorhizobium americanum]|uniref:hypothetical protein n=1 Tax=Sinorhizobium americanum TaxID=194963 RepID=UPI001F1FEA7F|nr:hypothetical protein [Sinorhizobium americanum]